jgi:hypothetical protein
MFSKGRSTGLGLPSSFRPYGNKTNKGDKNNAHPSNLPDEGVTETETISSPRANNQVAESPVCVPGTHADDLPAETPLDAWLERVQDARHRLAQTHGEGKHTLEWQKQWDPPRVRPCACPLMPPVRTTVIFLTPSCRFFRLNKMS